MKTSATNLKDPDTAPESAEEIDSQIRNWIHATDECIQSHPWQAVGVAAGVGLLLGYLLCDSCGRTGN